MEILDKKSNRMSRVIVGVFEADLSASFAEITSNQAAKRATGIAPIYPSHPQTGANRLR